MTAHAATAFDIRQQGGLDAGCWPVFDPFPLRAAVTTRHGGVSRGAYATLNLSLNVGDDAAAVLENRRRAAGAVGASAADFVFAEQTHGHVAAVVSAADRGAGAADPAGAIRGADALVTRDPAVVLAVLAADCVPLVLYDPDARVLACAHAGWRGTVARAAGAAVAAMRDLGARPADVIAGLGPAISPDAYQVGEEVAAAAEEAFGPHAGGALRPNGPGRWLFDLWAANRLVLRDAGVPDGQIHVAAAPTGPAPGLFFSHRAARPCGRFATMARLTPGGRG